MVECHKCEKPDLVWDMEYNTNTGNWRLWDNNLERPHECPKEISEAEEKVFCPKCDPMKRKLMSRKKLQKHIKTEHIDWVDYE